MTTARLLSNFIKQIPQQKKRDILIGAASGGTFGAIAGLMATDPTTEDRCEIAFKSGLKGLLTGAAVGAASRNLNTLVAKALNSKPYSNKIYTLVNAYESKVLGFIAGNSSAKEDLRAKNSEENEEYISSLKL